MDNASPEPKPSPRLFVLVGVACMSGMLFGYNTIVVNPAKLLLEKDFPRMSDNEWYGHIYLLIRIIGTSLHRSLTYDA